MKVSSDPFQSGNLGILQGWTEGIYSFAESGNSGQRIDSRVEHFNFLVTPQKVRAEVPVLDTGL